MRTRILADRSAVGPGTYSVTTTVGEDAIHARVLFSYKVVSGTPTVGISVWSYLNASLRVTYLSNTSVSPDPQGLVSELYTLSGDVIISISVTGTGASIDYCLAFCEY